MKHRQTNSELLPARRFDEIVAAFPGRIGVCIKDLDSGALYDHASNEMFPAASIIKVPVMVELLRQAEQGLLSLDQPCLLGAPICRCGTGTLKDLQSSLQITLRKCCQLMIVDSDNMATDVLIDLLGRAKINKTISTLGLSHTHLAMSIGRWHYSMAGIPDEPFTTDNDLLVETRAASSQLDIEGVAFQQSLANNVSSPKDMAVMMERIHRGTLINSTASSRMLEMLSSCGHRRMIPRHLSPQITVAHKIGQSHCIRGDVGIVLLPSGPLIIAAMTLAVEKGRQRPGVSAIAEISRLAVEAFCPSGILRSPDSCSDA